MCSIHHRMSGRTGKFRPHLIPSALPVSLSKKKKKDKNKSMESQFKSLALYRKKAMFCSHSPSSVSMNLEGTCHCLQEVWVREWLTWPSSQPPCKTTLAPSSCAHTCLPFLWSTFSRGVGPQRTFQSWNSAEALNLQRLLGMGKWG